MTPERIPRIVYEESRKRLEEELKEGGINTWCEYRRLLSELKLEKYWKENKVSLDEEKWINLLEERIQQREEKQWLERVKRRDKLRTYVKFKRNLQKEKYLDIRDRFGVPELVRLRGGTNRLKIEKGRYSKTPAEERVCEFCGTGQVEDELHFMLICPLYRDLRKVMWESVRSLLPQPCMIFADEDKFVVLMQAQTSPIAKHVLKYVKQAMKVRRSIEKTREKEEDERRRI